MISAMLLMVSDINLSRMDLVFFIVFLYIHMARAKLPLKVSKKAEGCALAMRRDLKHPETIISMNSSTIYHCKTGTTQAPANDIV